MITTARASALARDCDARPTLIPSGFGRAAVATLERHDAAIASVYVETRLGGGLDSQTDLLFAINYQHRERFASWLASAPAHYRPEIQRGVERLCQLWCSPGSVVHEQVPTIWLECDGLVGDSDSAQAPSVSVCLVPGYLRADAPLPASNPELELELMVASLEALRGRPCTVNERRRLRMVLDSLPDGGKLIHLSSMLGRRPCATKLYVVVPRAQMLEFLTGAGWRGPRAELAALVDELAPPARVGDELYLDLTLDDLHAPEGGRVGLAFAQQHLTRSEERTPSRAPLLDACVARGLCHAAEAEQLVSWAGSERRILDGEDWPSLIRRWLDLKLVWRPGAPLELKAYLGWSARAVSIFDVAPEAS